VILCLHSCRSFVVEPATDQIELSKTPRAELAGDPDAGMDRSCFLMSKIKAIGSYEVHLIPDGRYGM
jgi:hypothetical protein